ncbi:MAG: PAS domain S-box protein [Longimicrobiales bacterium]
MEAAQLGIWRYDLATDCLEWNDQLMAIHGVTPDSFDGTMDAWRERVHPDDLARAEEGLTIVASGQVSHGVEFRIVRPDGTVRHVQASGTPVRDRNGAIIGMMGINVDVTSLKENEEVLREREAFLDAIVRHSPNGILVADDGGNYRSANAAAAHILGYSVEELESMNVAELRLADRTSAGERYEEYRSRGVESGEIHHIRPDGLRCVARYHAVRIAPDFNLSILADVTEQKRLEREVQRAHNIESLGVLAGGIAHDFNNILTVITGNLSLLQSTLEVDADAAELLQEALDATDRTRDLARQLLTFAKGGDPVREAASAAELVRSTTIQSLRGSNTKPEFDFPPDLSPIDVDLGQIAQVIQNLVINADQAMPRGGVLRIRAENVEVEEGGGVDAGSYVRLTVEDQGGGIPEDHLRQVFDPYFSTKDAGHGLGLAISHSIVQRHGGGITVESQVGVGTTFVLHLPVARQPVPEEAAAVKGAPRTLGYGRALLMDDEEVIHRTVGRLLGHLGYDVEGVRDGSEAVQAFRRARQAGRPFDLVLLDLTVPGGMGGLEACARIREVDQDVRIVVSSGYADDPVLTRPEEYGFTASLAKPMRRDELLDVLRELAAPGPRGPG